MQNGKGDGIRTGADPKKYRVGWDNIEWPSKKEDNMTKEDVQTLAAALEYWEGYLAEHYDEGCEHRDFEDGTNECICFVDPEEFESLEKFRKLVRRNHR